MRNQKCIRKTISEDTGIKSFLDMIAPSVVKFNPDHFICGNTFRCVWALREYPTQTDEQALLRHLGEKDGITLRIYTRQLTPAEEDRIIQNATNKNRMGSSNTNDLRQTVTAESNLQDVASLIASMHRNREPLFHCAVYLELTAPDYDALKLLQTDVLTELVRSKLNVDKLLLRQQQGFCCVSPVGYNAFGAQFERVLPANSVANLYPFNYSGKTDAKGFYIGKDKYGSNNKKLRGQPGIESITKQYLYQLAYQPFVEAHQIGTVRNCFLMPTSSAEIVEKGTASLSMLSELGLQDIQVRLLPAEMMYRHYIDNTKLDLQLLNL